MSRSRERAIVLAAGFGERMRPLSLDRPKPLMPVWGRPALERVLLMLRDWGVRDVVVNVHAGADAVFGFLRRGSVPGLRVAVSWEPSILGTGGALVRARWFFGDAPFWIVNADIAVAGLDPAPFRSALRRPPVLAAVWTDVRRGPRTVTVRGGRIDTFHAPSPGAPGTATFCGVHLATPDIFSFLPRDERFGSVVDAYDAALRAGRRVAAVEQPAAFWADLGTPDRMLAAHREWKAAGTGACSGSESDDVVSGDELRRRGVRVRGFATVSREAVIGRGAGIEDSIIWPGACVAPRARLHHAIIGRGAVARGHVEGPLVRADLLLPPSVIAKLEPVLGRAISAEPLAPRGSDRTFVRLRGARGAAMLIRHGCERPENERYAGHARFLTRLGLRAPKVLLDSTADRWIVMEDLGSRTLESRVRHGRPADIEAAYAAVVRRMVRWHTAGARAARRAKLDLEEPFGPALYRREHDLFVDHYLAGRLGVSRAVRAAVHRELSAVARRLAVAPPVLLHRDLQSTNILWVRSGPAFIDFQGMRFGPAAVDLASLLCDPYVDLPAGLPSRMLDLYTRLAGYAIARPDLFFLAAIQRLTQAIGAYARMGAIHGAERFLAHIPPALARLAAAQNECPLSLPNIQALSKS